MKGQEKKWDWNPNLHLSLRLPKGGLFWFVFLFPTQSTCKIYYKIEFLEDSNRLKPRSLEETSTLTLVAMMTLFSPFIIMWHGGSSWRDNPVLVLDVHFQSSPALVVAWFVSPCSSSDSIIRTQFLRTQGSHWPHAQYPGSRDTHKRWGFLEVKHTKVCLWFTWERKVPTAELELTNIRVL